MTFMFGMATDPLGSKCAKRKGRVGAEWKRAGNVLGGDLPKCITPRLW